MGRTSASSSHLKVVATSPRISFAATDRVIEASYESLYAKISHFKVVIVGCLHLVDEGCQAKFDDFEVQPINHFRLSVSIREPFISFSRLQLLRRRGEITMHI
ncbi:hypothetical protein L3X38_015064 [Prunus dulcis]|uniref:Uncharacterized protein n=1 Tax=Prunus dulcis TaxID=3755 RepID=A0AAD4ZIK2_PRUDU|nr:hypothetical protein L3X38_015064 [Prunus dulcis]